MLSTQEIVEYLSKNKSYFREKYFIDKMAIIGSYARGDYDQDSDVDLIVYFLPEANKRLFRIYISLQEELALQFSRNVDIIVNGKVLPAFREIIKQEAVYV